MATHERQPWELTPLSAEDHKLVDVYKQLGKPIDELPYSAEFEKLIQILQWGDSMEIKHFVFQRLLLLRKRGRLPTIGYSPAELI